METNYDVVVIGGGAAGMMSAIFSAKNGNSTLLIEHNEKLGKKLYITGKGKCNLTNNSPVDTHIQNIITNSKFMFSALNAFTPQDTIEFFENSSLKLKTERGKRVFPASYKSSDVIKALVKNLSNFCAKVTLNTEVKDVFKTGEKFYIQCANQITYTANCVILATGGLSYKSTGSCDFGLKVAQKFGHNIVQPRPALCPIIVKDDLSSIANLALRNVSLHFVLGKINYNFFGDLLFTKNSLTGPIALTLSSHINKLNLNGAQLYVDLKPALSEQQLINKLERELPNYKNKTLKTYLATILPTEIIDLFIKKLAMENKLINKLSTQNKMQIISLLKKFDFSIKSLDNIDVGIVTSGGVDTKQINPKTMESKLVKNLYFAGEVIDVDALTGGFNLQIAWSTGYVAGNSVKGKL